MSSTELAPLAPGEIVAGKYRVDSLIGEGGMGYVLSAEHVELGHKVALKLLRPSVMSSEATERFLREARAAARLQSDHIAKVSDVGKLPDGTPFMVMELLEGQDLAKILDTRAPLPIEEAVDYLVHACEALADAHRHGIVHRDLKPANLFVTTKVDGTPFLKVLDFGISKARLGEPVSDITSTEAIIGSPKYMSPEQMQDSRNVDPRSDVWALGAILFEMLTARRAFDAPTIAMLCVRILQEDPPSPREFRPDLPEALEGVVLRCLRRDVAERTASVAQLAAELAPFASVDTCSLIARIGRAHRGGGSRPKIPDATPSKPASLDSLVASSSTAKRLRAARARAESETIGEALTPSPASATVPPKSRRGRAALAAAVLAAAAILGFVALRGRGDDGAKSVAAQPQPRAEPSVTPAASMSSGPAASEPAAVATSLGSAQPGAPTAPTAPTGAPSASSSAAPPAPPAPRWGPPPPRGAPDPRPPAAAVTTAPPPPVTAQPVPSKPPGNDAVLDERR